MAALRGISLSEVLSANMKNIQEVYGIKMQRLSGASKENDLYGRRGFHINLEMTIVKHFPSFTHSLVVI